MALDIKLRYLDDDPSTAVRQGFDVIKLYIRPGGTIPSTIAAAEIDSLTPWEMGSNDKPVKNSGSFLPEFWEMYPDIARQIPYNHSSQDRLVALASDLLEIPMWSNSQSFDIALLEQGRETDLFEDELEEWINLSSFIARLYSWKLNLPRVGICFAVQALREALEKKNNAPTKLNDCRIRAAAQYIEHCGDRIFRVMRDDLPERHEQRALRSEDFAGEFVFSMERWHRWQACFVTNIPTTLSRRAKAEATRAAKLMRDTDIVR